MGLGFEIRMAGAELVNSLNPIRVFNTNQARKLGSDVMANRALSTTFHKKGVGYDYASRAAYARTAGPSGFGNRMQSYFAGHSFDMSPKWKGYEQIARKNMYTRRITAGLLGGATVGSLFMGRDSLPANVGVSGLQGGAIGIAAAGALEYGARSARPWLGRSIAGGLLGVTAYNAMKPGNQIGPY